MKKYFLLMLVLMGALGISAQGLTLYGVRMDSSFVVTDFTTGNLEFLQVDPLSAAITPQFSIPNSFASANGSVAYDHARGRYIFTGLDDQGNNAFYAIGVNGDTIVKSLYTNPSPFPIGIKYDLQLDTTVGLWYDTQADIQYLVHLNLQNGTFTQIAPINGVSYIALGTMALNSNTHRYVFLGLDSALNKSYYYVNAQTGQVLYQIPMGDDPNLGALHFDLNTDRLYGLSTEVDSSLTINGFNYRRMYLVEVDTATAGLTKINPNPILEGTLVGATIHGGDFDQMTGTLAFMGVGDTIPEQRLVLVDVNNGQVITDQVIPPLQAHVSPLLGVKFDNQAFARMAYGDNTTAVSAPIFQSSVKLYPNPARQTLTVEMPEIVQEMELRVWNLQGQEVMSMNSNETSVQAIDIQGLAPGLYTLSGRNSKGLLFARRWVKQ